MNRELETGKFRNYLSETEKNTKVRRYLDYPKFFSLINTNSLYFARPTEFDDPLDSLLPKFHGVNNSSGYILLNQQFAKQNAKLYLNSIISKVNETYGQNPTRDQLFIVFQHFLIPLALNGCFIDSTDLIKEIMDSIWEIIDSYIANERELSISILAKLILDVGSRSMVNTQEMNKKRALVNCWHMDNESELMWHKYSNNAGIAIETTANQLESLDFKKYIENNCTCIISKVEYINLEEKHKIANEKSMGEKTEYKNLNNYYFEKSKCFSAENELRLVILESTENILLDYKKNKKFPEKGELVKINTPIEKFIEKIIISPNSPDYYKDTLYETLINLKKPELAGKINVSDIQSEQENILKL